MTYTPSKFPKSPQLVVTQVAPGSVWYTVLVSGRYVIDLTLSTSVNGFHGGAVTIAGSSGFNGNVATFSGQISAPSSLGGQWEGFISAGATLMLTAEGTANTYFVPTVANPQ